MKKLIYWTLLALIVLLSISITDKVWDWVDIVDSVYYVVGLIIFLMLAIEGKFNYENTKAVLDKVLKSKVGSIYTVEKIGYVYVIGIVGPAYHCVDMIGNEHILPEAALIECDIEEYSKWLQEEELEKKRIRDAYAIGEKALENKEREISIGDKVKNVKTNRTHTVKAMRDYEGIEYQVSKGSKYYKREEIRKAV